MRLSPAEFAENFADAFKVSAFRLELLDAYVAANETEHFRRYLAGEPQDPSWREPWQAAVRAARMLGKTISRVHVVTEPLTPYAAFELTCAYPASVEAGEDIRILARDHAEPLDLFGKDFWLLDSRSAGVMDYDRAGNWLAVDLTTDPELIAELLRTRDAAMAHAIPLHTYLEQKKEILHERRAS